ncbi:uncharacterized protein V6R79_010100 [Siganus canaliculatus]
MHAAHSGSAAEAQGKVPSGKYKEYLAVSWIFNVDLSSFVFVALLRHPSLSTQPTMRKTKLVGHDKLSAMVSESSAQSERYRRNKVYVLAYKSKQASFLFSVSSLLLSCDCNTSSDGQNGAYRINCIVSRSQVEHYCTSLPFALLTAAD